jgi:zinc transporter ZupT
MNQTVALYSLIVFVVAFCGGLLALVRKWSETQLHTIVAFGAGIFLAATFIHLLPEAMSGEHAQEAGAMVLVGFLLVLFVERFLLSRPGQAGGGHVHTHMVVSMTALIGLSVHTLIGGLGLAVGATQPEVGRAVLVSILAHKIPETFVMVTLMMLAGIKMRRVILNLALLCLMTPVGALLLSKIVPMEGSRALSMLTGLVAGTFLYVATGNLLPEVFHLRERRGLNLTLLVIGAILMAGLGFYWHEAH